MTAELRARAAYSQPESVLNNPRAMEYELLARATAALTSAQERKKEDFPGLAAALDRNLRLWSALAADLSREGNRLPSDLRRRLLYLHEFTAMQSRKVLAGSATVAPLIAINMAVMRGLRGEAAT